MKQNNRIKIITLLYCLFTISMQAQDFTSKVENHFNKLQSEGKLLSQDSHWKITSEHTSSISNVHHIYFSQEINGFILANTESSLHLLPNGEVLESNNRFIKNIQSKLSSGSVPSLSAIDAVKAIANQMNYNIISEPKIIEEKIIINQETRLTSSGIAREEIKLKLKYFQNEDEKIVLVWEVNLWEVERLNLWDFYVDANTGVILNKVDNYFSCIGEETTVKPTKFNYNSNLFDTPNYKKTSNNTFIECENCYEVIPFPFESPYETERVIRQSPSNSIASPYGWHDIDGNPGAEYYIAFGNNINAKFDDDNYSPNGGEFLNFTDYPFSENYSEENRYIDASLTDVFYWANLIHDVLYTYGFNEAAGNFQNSNYENNGFLDNDAITILGQDDFQECNAGVFMGPDGFAPRMLMGVCGNKDSNFDNTVVIHEYAHGLTYRLIGGAMSTSCFGLERMDEGYSDWYGLLFTMMQGDNGEDARGYAPYFFNQGPNGPGIRQYPYTTNMNINPLIYNNNPSYDSKINWIWASILWDVTWELIDQFGYDENIYNFSGELNQDAGNIMALAIVTESLKNLNCGPTLIDCRNAILVANESIYGKKYECILWEAFAKRGLGVFAFVGGPASYETPPLTATFSASLNTVCEKSEIIEELSGGLPEGGVYSGVGVIDDGNGRTYSFDPEIAGIGIHTVTYEVLDDFCIIASTNTDTIVVELDTKAPEYTCPESISVIIPIEESNY